MILHIFDDVVDISSRLLLTEELNANLFVHIIVFSVVLCSLFIQTALIPILLSEL